MVVSGTFIHYILCVCVCVCVCVYVYECMYVCMYVCVCIYIYMYVCACMYVCTICTLTVLQAVYTRPEHIADKKLQKKGLKRQVLQPLGRMFLTSSAWNFFKIWNTGQG